MLELSDSDRGSDLPSAKESRFARVWNAFDGLASDTLWSMGHDVLVLVTALISFKVLQTLPLERYGAYVGLHSALAIVGAMSYAGGGLALLQRLLGERADLVESTDSFLSLALMAGSGSVVAVTLIAPAFFPLTRWEIFLLTTAELLGAAMVFVCAMAVQGSSGFGAATRIRMGAIGLRFAITIGLGISGRLSVLGVASGFCFVLLLYSLYLLIFHLPKSGYVFLFKSPSKAAVSSTTMFSMPMGASGLQTDGDKVMLNAFGFSSEAGLYGAAYRVLTIGIAPLMALDTAAFQRFLPRGDGEPGLHWRRSIRMGALMLGASTFVVAGIYLFLPLFEMVLLGDGEYKNAVEIVPWLLPIIPLIATSNTPMNGLLGLGLPRLRMNIYLVSALVSVVLYFLLIPVWGWRGAVAATIISEVILSIIGWGALWVAQRSADAQSTTVNESLQV